MYLSHALLLPAFLNSPSSTYSSLHLFSNSFLLPIQSIYISICHPPFLTCNPTPSLFFNLLYLQVPLFLKDIHYFSPLSLSPLSLAISLPIFPQKLFPSQTILSSPSLTFLYAISKASLSCSPPTSLSSYCPIYNYSVNIPLSSKTLWLPLWQ